MEPSYKRHALSENIAAVYVPLDLSGDYCLDIWNTCDAKVRILHSS